jgi:hypothetical protein
MHTICCVCDAPLALHESHVSNYLVAEKKGKNTIDFDELLEGTADPGWLTGVPAAMAMEEDAPAAAAAATEPTEVNMGGMSTPAPGGLS